MGLSATSPAQKLPFLLFTSAEGKESPLPFWGPSQSFGFSLLPLGVRRPEVTKYQHLLIPLCDLHSSLTVTFLTDRHCSFQREDSINLISIVSVGYHVTVNKFPWLIYRVTLDGILETMKLSKEMSSGLFKILLTTNFWFTNHMYKHDLAFLNLQCLKCYKTNQPNSQQWTLI